eukprot:10178035-Alexandrium_andersonii.AAC.1
MRLLYVARVVANAPPALKALMQVSNEWQLAFVHDLADLHRSTRKLADLPPPDLMLAPWVELMQAHPGSWRGLVR